MKKVSVATIVIIALVAAGAFFGGMKYQEGKIGSTNSSLQFQGGFGGANQRGGGGAQRLGTGNGFRPVTGEVLSSDDKSLTVKMQDGSSKIVLFSDSTQISNTLKASVIDLKKGETVSVFGTENSDGSVTAQNIQLNPLMGLRGLRGTFVPSPT